MARTLDSVQLISLYRQRLDTGELFTPQLSAPADMVNYFIYVGNALAQANKDAGIIKPIIIRYAIDVGENLFDDQKELERGHVKRHRQTFRTTLSRVKKDFTDQGKTLIQFKANAHSAYKLEEGSRFIVFAWEFKIKAGVNSIIAALGDSVVINPNKS